MKTFKINLLLFISILLIYSCAGEKRKFELPTIISNNMVLQQNQEVILWGKAHPGSKVLAEASWNTNAEVKTGDDSCWLLKLKTPTAGGPFELTFKNNDTIVKLENIMLGEVWICSGQSNMEMPVTGWPPTDTILNSANEITQANYPTIRMFTVQRAYSAQPETQCQGNWQVCSPATVGNFSATAYFFGRMLHKELGVPIGLIHSSWGGTPAESWTTSQKLSSFNEFALIVAQLDSVKPQIQKLEKYLDSLAVLQPDMNSKTPWANLSFKDEEVSKPEFNDEKWKLMSLPKTFENSEIGQFNGVVWFRKTISIPENWNGKDLVLELGPIDDMDITFFNGEMVGSHEAEGEWQTLRKYKVPAKLVKAGQNILAVRVLDTRGGGGIYGKETDLKIYPANQPKEQISLSGEWKYLPVALFYINSFRIFEIVDQGFYSLAKLPVDLGPSTPSGLYNGMINPLAPYTIKGAIWYQGESNAGNPELYSRLFPAMIESWREKWNQGDFPFYYVQIAPFDYGTQINSACLREAQMKTLSLKNTGMVVTLDIGNPVNIHPANKQDVGHRLALWALAKDYGKQIVCSGPVYSSMEVKGNEIVISFNYTDGGLTSKLGGLKNFEIAGADKKFIKANAVIEGNNIIVKSLAVKNPVAVRYLWDNTSEASFFNGNGLPASSFRTDNW